MTDRRHYYSARNTRQTPVKPLRVFMKSPQQYTPKGWAIFVANSDPEPAPAPERPRTRLDCVNEPRPCPFVSCKHHLWLDVTSGGSIMFNRPDVALEDMGTMEDTCALDVAARGRNTIVEVAALLGTTREWARQLEIRALRKLGGSVEVRRILEGISAADLAERHTSHALAQIEAEGAA